MRAFTGRGSVSINGGYEEDRVAIYRVQMCWQDISGSSEDRYCNTWHIDAPIDYDWLAGSPSNGDQVLGMFTGDPDGFYRLVSDFMSSMAAGIGATFKIYSLADAEPRTPVYQYMFPVTPPWGFGSSAADLPNELAACLSFEAIGVAGTNRARRRGRVYLGPLNEDALERGSTGVRISETFQGVILAAYNNLVVNLATKDIGIGMYSPTDELWLPTQRAWVDNAVDVQRRRGIRSNHTEEWIRS